MQKLNSRFIKVARESLCLHLQYNLNDNRVQYKGLPRNISSGSDTLRAVKYRTRGTESSAHLRECCTLHSPCSGGTASRKGFGDGRCPCVVLELGMRARADLDARGESGLPAKRTVTRAGTRREGCCTLRYDDVISLLSR